MVSRYHSYQAHYLKEAVFINKEFSYLTQMVSSLKSS